MSGPATINGGNVGKQQRPAGVEQALLAKLELDTLPKTMAIKDRVDAGGTLTERDIGFLDNVLTGLRRDGPHVQEHPQWASLYNRMIDLYNEITRKALENEQRG